MSIERGPLSDIIAPFQQRQALLERRVRIVKRTGLALGTATEGVAGLEFLLHRPAVGVVMALLGPVQYLITYICNKKSRENLEISASNIKSMQRMNEELRPFDRSSENGTSPQ